MSALPVTPPRSRCPRCYGDVQLVVEDTGLCMDCDSHITHQPRRGEMTMPTNEGNALAYVSSNGGRPIPHTSTQPGIRPTHVPQPPKRTGLDWSRHTAVADAPAAAEGDRVRLKPPHRRTPSSTFNLTEAKRLYLDEEASCAQIADRIGSTVATVRRHLKEAGVTMRDDRARNSGGRNTKTIDDYDPILVADICRRYVDEQQTTTQVAEALGHTPKLVTTILNRAGVPMRPAASVAGRKGRDQKLDDTARADICRRYQAGESSVVLAAAHGVSRPTVLSVLRRNDVPVRSKASARQNHLTHQPDTQQEAPPT